MWSRVYYYAIITTFASLAFFASPGKQWLKAQHEKRSHDAGIKIIKNLSTDSLTSAGLQQEPILGLSQDPGADANEAVDEIRAQIERAKAEQARRRNKGQTLGDAVREKAQVKTKTI